jgi:hypothetical protein
VSATAVACSDQIINLLFLYQDIYLQQSLPKIEK